MEYIRSFIAVELPEGLKDELRHLQAVLGKRAPAEIKWVDPASIHLTLKFLGEVVSDKISEIQAAMAEAVKGIPPFRLEVKGVGAFPNLNRVQVIWVGIVGETEKLARLVERIETSISPLGFPTEARPFTAHLTLARVGREATPEDRKKLGQLIASTAFASKQVIEVNSVNLMKSQLTRQGAIHSRISTAMLK